MPFKEVTMPSFRVIRKTTPRGVAHKDFQEFLASSFDCAEVDISQFSSLDSAYTTYYSLARNYGYPVAVRRIGGKLYLLRRTQRERTFSEEARKNCPYWNCPNRNEIGYCKTKACINPVYQ